MSIEGIKAESNVRKETEAVAFENRLMGPITAAIYDAVRRAREGHGPFPKDAHRGLTLITEELGELAEAVADMTRSKPHPPYGVKGIADVRRECLDLITNAVQYLDNVMEEEKRANASK